MGEMVKDRETALHDISCIESAIIFEQDLINKAIEKTQQKIELYRKRIERLKEIANEYIKEGR